MYLPLPHTIITEYCRSVVNVAFTVTPIPHYLCEEGVESGTVGWRNFE